MPSARLIIAGWGLAGLVAALRAVELGAHVNLLEKGGSLGGSFLYSSGYLWTYRDLETYRRQAPAGDPVLQKLILNRLEEGLCWLEDRGAPVLSRETNNPLTFGVRLDPDQTVTALTERILAGGSRINMDTALDSLVQDADGRVSGTQQASATKGERWAEASDAVVLASGGFAGDPELVRRYIIGGPGRLRLRTHPRSTGDGFRAALAAGALESAGLEEFYGRNLPAGPAKFPPERFVEVSQLYGRHAVAINSNGERYADESADWSETALTRATALQPGLRAWYVLDSAGLQEQFRERTVGEMVATARRAGGIVLQEESLDELADRLAERGVARENFLRTMNGYNAAVEDGRNERLFPRRSAPAAPVRTPPFVAVEVAPTITHTIGGLAVDGGCRVLRRSDGRPLPGLYAAGVEVGGVSAGGYSSGLAAALVFGRIAAASAVGEDAAAID
ncbi:MAG: FAD-binding protein [Actinobacteria bacterium]|nr:FAD-binding protein [Actinomycetota bacterium]